LPQDPLRAAEHGRAHGVSPLIGQVLLNRGLVDGDGVTRFLTPKLAHLTRPDQMVDRAVAAARLAEAVKKRERIVIFGDYDVDGTTSAAILADILEALGGDVRALVANRFSGGYGLSDAALDRALTFSPRVLVTCDCGSSDHPRVARARALGIDVIVVDHHLVPSEPLAALAFLNPHRPDCGFAFKGLCSAGLALSVGAAVRAELGQTLDLRAWLDLVALGTIADVAPLEGDNRALVRAGIALLCSDTPRPGIAALREVARVRSGTALGAIDIAFRLTPRLNAAGRLGDPSITLELLRARTLDQARALAFQIERLNTERKDIERKVTERALALVAADLRPRSGLLAADETFHRGVVGITAARLVDKLGLPSLVVAIDGDHAHGSARAPDGFPLFEAIQQCAPLLQKFGGHDAAAGFSLHVAQIDDFREAFDDACRKLWPRLSRERALVQSVDARIDGKAFGLPGATELAMLEPLGESNPEPLFEVRGEIARIEVVGDGHLKVALRVNGRDVGAFGFMMGERRPALTSGRAQIHGHLRPDSWRGGDALELRIVEIAQSADDD
jgi:single-stranded-DNA-specific exonuclease